MIVLQVCMYEYLWRSVACVYQKHEMETWLGVFHVRYKDMTVCVCVRVGACE